MIIDYKILAQSLSDRLGRVIAMRGNSGAGKSYLMKKYLQEKNHLIHGILNPDYIKAILKKLDGQQLLNHQVYLEGRVIFERLIEELIEHTSGVIGAVIDTRLLDMEDFQKIFAFAQSRGKILEIIDVEAPIWCSILTVLNRDPFGVDPCVSFEEIKKGYIKARINRGEFIVASSSSNQVHYSLYRLTREGQYVQIVRKGEGDDFPFMASSQKEFDECLKAPAEEEMEGIANTIITPEIIQSLDVPRDKEVLWRWIGFTVKDALDAHSSGLMLASEEMVKSPLRLC